MNKYKRILTGGVKKSINLSERLSNRNAKKGMKLSPTAHQEILIGLMSSLLLFLFQVEFFRVDQLVDLESSNPNDSRSNPIGSRPQKCATVLSEKITRKFGLRALLNIIQIVHLRIPHSYFNVIQKGLDKRYPILVTTVANTVVTYMANYQVAIRYFPLS